MSQNEKIPDKLNLLDFQKKDLDTLVEKMTQRWEYLKVHQSKNTKESMGEVNNVFGLLGDRGTGKSSILSYFPEYESVKNSPFIVLRPIDCLTIPKSIPLTLTILIRISEYFGDYSKPIESEEIKEASEKLIDLSKEFLSITEESQQLSLELSGSFAEYSTQMIRLMRMRMGFRQRLNKIINTAFHYFQEDKKVLVILLDDFDLSMSSEGYIERLTLLLEDLSQFRIFIIVSAHYHRLENLSLDEKYQIDEKTGRAITHKMLPNYNRVYLTKWDLESIKNSRFRDRVNDVLNTLPNGLFQNMNILKVLLPERPRGLIDFLNSLENHSSNAEDELEIQEALRILALSREEPIFSRELLNTPLDTLTKRFKFTKDPFGKLAWLKLVLGILERFKNKDFGIKNYLPIERLVPTNSFFKKDDIKLVYKDFIPSSRDDVDSSVMPLRDFRIELAVTKDISEGMVPFWVELLLNLSFLVPENTQSTRWKSNRLNFFSDWQPLKERLNQCFLEQHYSKFDFYEYLHDAYYLPIDLCYQWTRLATVQGEDSNLSQVLHFGWWPLQSLIGGDNSNTLNPHVSQDEFDFLDPNSEPGVDLGVGMIPGEVWSMVIFVDGLVRCPWQVFSKSLNWLPVSLVCLSAALVKAAYLYGLKAIGMTLPIENAPNHQVLLDVLEIANIGDRKIDETSVVSAKEFLRLQEDGMRAFLDTFFAESIEVPEVNSLAKAYNHFVQTRAYLQAAHFLTYVQNCES